MNTDVMIVGHERLEIDEAAALMESLEKRGAFVSFFTMKKAGIDWERFSKSLRGKSHFVLIVKGKDDRSALITNARTGRKSPRTSLVCLDRAAFEVHKRAIERHIDFTVVSNSLDHSRVPPGHSLMAANFAHSADDFARMLVPKNDTAV